MNSFFHKGGLLKKTGFTLIELILVVATMMILGAIAYPQVAARVTASHADNAARVIASDLREAVALTVRQGTPMKVEFDASAKVLRLRDRRTNAIVKSREFGEGTEFPVASVSASAANVFLFPNRLASAPFTLTLVTPSNTARVVLTRATIVSIEEP